MKSMLIALAAVGSLVAAGAAHAQVATEQQATDAGCTKCHKLDTKKVGPSLESIGAKYKGKPDAVATIFPEFRDSKSHKKVTVGDDELKQLIAWAIAH
jgi:cytochrome c